MIHHTVPRSLRATRLGFPRVRRWGKGRGKGELALTSHKFYICVPEWDAKLADWLIFNHAITLCSPGRACLQANRRDTFIGVEPSKTFYILL